MNSGRKGVPPQGRPAPTGSASTRITGTRIDTDGHGYENDQCESVLIRTPIVALLLIAALLLSACAGLRRIPTPTPAAAPVEPTRAAATPTDAASPAPTVMPSPTPLSPAAPPAPASWTDLTRFEQALRASTQTDLTGAQPPLHYQLEIRLDLEQRRIEGRGWIRFTNTSPAPLTEIPLRLYPNLGRADAVLRIVALTIAGVPAAPRLLAENSAAVVSLPQPLASQAALELYLEFEALLPAEGGGNHSTFGFAGGVLALAQFYPTVPRIGSAGWDLQSPPLFGDMTTADPGLYDVWITAPAAMTVVATGVTVQTSAAADGVKTWYIVGGPQREFNLVGSSAFTVQSRRVGDVAINSYFDADDAEGGAAVLEWASQAFDIYQQAFSAYPYTELDIVATPTDAGGVEYPGLVVIADRLYDQFDDVGSFFQIAVVHEVAHQWWYNLLGNDQVREPWLDEAVTQYATVLFYEDRYGAEGRAGVLRSFNERWNRVKATNDQPIGLPVASYEGRAYGAIVYGKGPLFLLALREQMGDAVFAQFLADFSTAYRWRTATADDFLAAAEKACACQLDGLFAEWVFPP